MYMLAEVLGKTVSEIGDMTCAEFQGWIAHFKLKENAKG